MGDLAANGLASEPSTAIEALRAVTEAFETPVFVLDEQGGVRIANLPARACAAGKNGLRLEGGRLRLNELAAQRQLDCAIGKALEGDRAAPLVRLSPSEAGRQAFLLARPVTVFGAAFVLVWIRDTGAHGDGPRNLMAAFGLTEREREVLALLVVGEDVAAISRRMRVAIATVRSHIQHALAKLEVERQAHLIRAALAASSF